MGACCHPQNSRNDLDMRDQKIKRGDKKGDKMGNTDRFADNAFKAQPSGKYDMTLISGLNRS